MRLKKFLEKLEEIAKKHGDKLEVIMADDIPVVNPVFSNKYPYMNKVVITDEE